MGSGKIRIQQKSIRNWTCNGLQVIRSSKQLCLCFDSAARGCTGVYSFLGLLHHPPSISWSSDAFSLHAEFIGLETVVKHAKHWAGFSSSTVHPLPDFCTILRSKFEEHGHMSGYVTQPLWLGHVLGSFLLDIRDVSITSDATMFSVSPGRC